MKAKLTAHKLAKRWLEALSTGNGNADDLRKQWEAYVRKHKIKVLK